MPNRLVTAGARHPRRSLALLLACVASVALLAVAALAVAKSFTLSVAKNVHVTNAQFAQFAAKAVDTHENVAVGQNGRPVYTFQGETTHHIICKKTKSMATNCWGFWPPVSPASAKGLSKQAGISGTLGTFHNQGQLQLTLNGHPLYFFLPDLSKKNPKSQANGDQLKTFGSIWHIVKAAGGQSAAGSGSGTGTMSTGTTTSPYPPGY